MKSSNTFLRLKIGQFFTCFVHRFKSIRQFYTNRKSIYTIFLYNVGRLNRQSRGFKTWNYIQFLLFLPLTSLYQSLNRKKLALKVQEYSKRHLNTVLLHSLDKLVIPIKRLFSEGIIVLALWVLVLFYTNLT